MILAHQRCFHHAHREAAARCLECREYFCRECVTEHDGRVVCAGCLKKLAAVRSSRRAAFVWVLRLGQMAGGLVVALIFFYWLGQTLLSLPASFHDGTLWRGNWLDQVP